MGEIELINNKISKIITGLRTVLRHKATNLGLLISMSNGFLNLNYPINPQILEYDSKNNNNSTKEQQQKFETKFRKARDSLIKIKTELEIVTKTKTEIPIQDVTSFQDLPNIIDLQLTKYQEIISKLIPKIPKESHNEAYDILNTEINNLLK